MRILPLLLVGGVASAAPPPQMPNTGASMPAFSVTRWVNSPPLTPAGLSGKVVLVDFWEYTCVNWIRTRPFVRAWNARYGPLGLVVVGVHSPEFEFGKLAANVDRGVRDHGLTYPIAIDNAFGTWRAFANDAWPGAYLFDADGKLQLVHLGEGNYAMIEDKIRMLLGAAGVKNLPPITDEVAAFQKMPVMPEMPFSDETYLGTLRREADQRVSRVGDWKIEGEYIEHVGGAAAKIVLDFLGGEVNLIMAPGKPEKATVQVRLDGKELGSLRGADVGADSIARFDRTGMIRLVTGAGPGAHRLELETRDPGLRAFVFTFGP